MLPKRLNLEQGSRAFRHNTVNASKPLVGIFDDMSQCDRLCHELVSRFTRRLEDHNCTTGRCFGRERDSGTRKAIQEEH